MRGKKEEGGLYLVLHVRARASTPQQAHEPADSEAGDAPHAHVVGRLQEEIGRLASVILPLHTFFAHFEVAQVQNAAIIRVMVNVCAQRMRLQRLYLQTVMGLRSSRLP